MLKHLKLILITIWISSVVVLVGCGASDSEGGVDDTTTSTTSTSTTSTTTMDNGHGDGGGSGTNTVDLSTYDKPDLTDDQKFALAFMWNEERLAYDLYSNMYKVTGVNQLNKIATNGETQHISLVKNAVEWYDINITNLVDYTDHYSQEELDSMPSGTYGIQAIQDLYDALYEYGIASAQTSLEVGCKVEVVDVNDLDTHMAASEGNQALIDTFTILIEGSYKHYWSFDSALKGLGVVDGCCSLGEDWCKTPEEYPSN